MLIYETDTKRVMMYNGTSWISITPQKIQCTTLQTWTSDVALRDIPGMSVVLEANSEYEIEYHGLAYGSGGDIQTSWVAPGGATGAPYQKECIGPTSVAAGFTSREQTAARFGGHGFNTAIDYQLNAAALGTAFIERITIATAGAGTLKLQAAQAAVSATVTTLTTENWANVWKRA
jgi:hypothetical protein